MRRVLIAAACALAAGCSAMESYVDARRYQSGGGAERDVAAAEARQVAERERGRELQATADARRRELADSERQVASLQRELNAQDRQLEAARRSKRLSEARYAELKRESDALKRELAAVRAQAAKEGARADASGDEAKRRQIEQLEQRKTELEKALAAATAR